MRTEATEKFAKIYISDLYEIFPFIEIVENDIFSKDQVFVKGKLIMEFGHGEVVFTAENGSKTKITYDKNGIIKNNKRRSFRDLAHSKIQKAYNLWKKEQENLEEFSEISTDSLSQEESYELNDSQTSNFHRNKLNKQANLKRELEI